MKKIKFTLFLIIFNIILLNCFSGEKKLFIKINPGKNYTHKYKFNGINLKLTPQTAIWIEDLDGNYIKTVYVTNKSAKCKWAGGRNIQRPSSLPVWAHKRGIQNSNGTYMPDKKTPLPDAETGATPKESYTKSILIDDNYNKIYVFIEINNSFDYNEIFSENLGETDENYSGVNGQPSLIYKAEVDLNNKSMIKMKLLGHGSLTGNDGNINTDLSTLTDALDIIQSIFIIYE